MENHGDTTPRKKRVTKMATKKCNIKSVKPAAVEKERTYGIDSLNLADTTHAENDSVREKRMPMGMNQNDS